MSLRNQIHSAFDEVAPPAFGLPERVVQTVLMESPSRRRREKLILRMRVPLSLAAVFVLVALVAGILIGGRLIQDWNSFRNGAPAGDSYQMELAQLEARPLVLPTPASHIYCNSGPTSSAGYGSGPVYGIGGPITTSSWGVYYHNLAHAEANISGPILVRASDLFTNQRVIFIGHYAAGPLAGHDTVDGVAVEQRTELVFDTSQASKPTSRYKFSWSFIAGVPDSWSGSTGWQIDGLGFSETFLVC